MHVDVVNLIATEYKAVDVSFNKFLVFKLFLVFTETFSEIKELAKSTDPARFSGGLDMWICKTKPMNSFK